MNLHVTRIRLSSVGPEPARFDPLDLDLMNSDGTGPADTVLFLPNTGGKTVLLRLLFSVLHPPIVERIGSEEAARRGRNLAGYILERDTAHVVVEWRRAEQGRFVGDEVLLTGLVAEWRGGRPTGNPSDLMRLWYSIRGHSDSVGIDMLTFDVAGASGDNHVRRRLPLRQFRESLGELSTSRRRGGVEVTLTDVQRDWVEHLDALGLDRALFRYQGEMNHNEAGASAIARFTKDLDFVAFFLNAVVDPSELAVLDREFEEVAEKVSRFPQYQQRVRFGEAALSELEPLATLVEEAARARIEAGSARHSALTLLAAFAGGARRAREREAAEHERYRQRDADTRRLSTLAERFRDEAREYRRFAAQFWLSEVESVYSAALDRLGRCELDQRAWTIAEDVIRFREASAEVRVLDAEYAAEMQRLRPFQESRDRAAQALALRLSADSVLADIQQRSEQARAAEAKQKAQRARTEERDALVEAARIDAVRQGKEQRVAEVAAHRTRLVAAGYLGSTDAADAARDREQRRSRDLFVQIEGIAAELRSLEAERIALDELEGAAILRRQHVQQQHDSASMAIDQAVCERAQLMREPAVIELAEADVFDLELVGASIAHRLHNRATEADAARVDLQVRGLEDRRALSSLDASGLLPPPQDVAAALQRLAEAGISGAMPGTRYVADAIAAGDRDQVVARRADLVGGIVLTDHANLERARSILRSAALDPTMIIAVGSASDLVNAEDPISKSDTFVVPPAASVWDRSVAASERARREARVASLEHEHAALDARASGSRSLAEALSRHATAYPVGWLASRTAERAALAGELGRLDDERHKRDARRRDISESVQRRARDSEALQQQALETERRAGALARLADDEATAAPLVEIINGLRNEGEEWRLVAISAGRDASIADDEAADASTNAQNQRAVAGRIRQELLSITLAEPLDPPSPEAARTLVRGDDLQELRLRFAEFERRLLGETSSSEVAARRALAIRTRDRLREGIDSRPIEVRDRADILLRLPEADDAAGRRAAADRTDAEVSASRVAERETYAERAQAQRDLGAIDDEIRTSRRTVKLADDQIPQDRHQAARFGATARQKADAHQSQVATAERERNTAREASEAAKSLADTLTNLSTPLEMALNKPTTEILPAASPYEGGLEDARTTGVDTLRRLTAAITAEDKAERAWRARDTALRAVLQRDEFVGLSTTDRLYRRLSQSPTEILARDSAELVAELRTSISVLRSELETMSEDVKLATMSLAKAVNKALSLLRLAETRSRMPKTLRDWADAPFLTIRFEKPPAEQLEARLATFVADVINRPTNRPAGTALLLQALERAVGQFSVQILKPNEAFALIRVPVTELSSQTFSNGQRSTVATALMLMLSELRRQSRGAARDASVGTLLLDNPFGNANAGFLIEVQRTVAAASSIQLVYTTGIADFNALRHFPNVVALSNDAARRTMRRYVRANPELLELLIPSNENPDGGRLSANRVVTVTDSDPYARG